MRVACLSFPHFAVQVEERDNRDLPGKPVIIGGFHYEAKAVYDVSEEAAACGVSPGVPLRQAYTLCPHGLYLPFDDEKYDKAFTHLLGLLAGYSPKIESGAPAYALLDLAYEPDEARFIQEIAERIWKAAHFHMSAGVASSRFAARVASQAAGSSRSLIIPQGEERRFLEGLPVDLLPASPELIRRLELLGIREIGKLMDLPCEAVELQFGAEGRRVWEMANCIDSTGLRTWTEPQLLEEELRFEPAVDSLDLLLAGADKLLDRLSRKLEKRWQYCRRLTVSLRFSNDHIVQRAFYFKEATASRVPMLSRLKHCFEQAGFTAPVSEMRLTLTDFCSEEGKQSSFLGKPSKHKERLWSAIHVLQQKHGRTAVKRAVPRRNARLPEEAFSFTLIDPQER